MVNVVRGLKDFVNFMTGKILDRKADKLSIGDYLKPAEVRPNGLKMIKKFNLVEEGL